MTDATLRPVLVTGSAGLLGSAVVRDLVAAGRGVIALDRNGAAPPEGVRFVEDDLSSRARLEALLAEVGAVVHCAAIPSPLAAPEDVVFNTNVTTTANLLYAAEAAGIRRFVYCSSQSALGLSYAPTIVPPDRLPVDEDHPCRPAEGYALSKIVGEQLCALFSARSGMVTRALRFPVIWRPTHFAEHTAKRLGDPVQAAKSQWAYVDVRDAARGCRAALDDRCARVHAVYNIVAPWPFAMDDPATRLAADYGDLPGRPGWRPGDPVLDPTRASDEMGFRAEWRWTPAGITHVAST